MTEMAEWEYRAFCEAHHLDPEDTASAIAYEEQFDADEAWREEQYQRQLREGWRTVR